MSGQEGTREHISRRGALWAGGAATVAGAGLVGGRLDARPSPARAAGSSGDPIVGSWLNTRTNNGGVAIATFSPDGGWSNAHPDRHRSPAHGTWERVGDRTYHITRWSLRFEDDQLIGTMKTRAETVIDPDGDGLTSRRISEQFDRAGNLVSTSRLVESRSTRIKAEPPR